MSQYTSRENINVSTSDTDAETRDILGIDEIRHKTLTTKNYIPKRSSKKLLTSLFIASSTIILFLIIIIIVVISLNRINTLEKKLGEFRDREKMNNNSDRLYLEQKENPSNKNNNSEKNVSYTKETTLPNVNSSEKINEKSENSFSEGTTSQGNNNNTEKIHEKSTTYFPQEDILQFHDSSRKPDSHLPQKIILHGDDSIFFFYPNTKEYELLYKNEHNISAFTVYNKGIIFATETNISQIYYLSKESLNATQKNLSIIFEEPKVKPYAIEIDFVSENLYIIDKVMEALIILNIKTKNYNLLLTDLKNPCDIVLDCIEGLMFIVQATDSILKSNMDGRQLMKIVENSGITAITVNKQEKRIYWVSDVSNIESSTYDGKNRKLFLTDSFYISSLAIVEDQLFWLCPTKGLSNGTLLFSKIDNGSCISTPSLEMVHILRDPKSINSNSYENQNVSKFFHHRCQHIGMRTPGHGYNCTCNIGWQLHSDWRSCRPVIDFILYNKANFIRGCMLDINKTTALDIMWPIPYHAGHLINKNSIHFDYDLKNDNLYFSDDRYLYKLKLKTRSSNQTVLLTIDKKFVIGDVVFDLFTGNLYYIVRSLRLGNNHMLKMFNTKLGIESQKTLKYFPCRYDLTFTGCPYAMIINPYQNALLFNKFDYYFTNNFRQNLRSMKINNMKGVNESEIIIRDDINIFNKNNINTFGLVMAIDYINDKIYRISESDSNTRISYTTFDCLNEKSFFIESVNHVKFISIHQQWLYFSNGTSIWRVHKETGKGVVKIIPNYEDNIYQRITAMKIISPSIHFTRSKNNLCVINNGNCEQFCFNGPMTCDCEDGKSIQNDGRHCN